MRRFFDCRRGITVAEILRRILIKWKEPPANLLDITYGSGYTMQETKRGGLTGVYNITSIDIDPKSKAQIIADSRYPENIKEIQGKQYDVIYADPPYVDSVIEAKYQKGGEQDKYTRMIREKIQPHYHKGFEILEDILIHLNNYKAWLKSDGVLILKIGDRIKDGKYIPQATIAINLLREYQLRMQYIYLYSTGFIHNYNYFQVYSKVIEND